MAQKQRVTPAIAKTEPIPPPDLEEVVRSGTVLKPDPLHFDFEAVRDRGTAEWFIEKCLGVLIVKATALTAGKARIIAREATGRLVSVLSQGHFSCYPFPREIFVQHSYYRGVGHSQVQTDYHVALVEVHQVAFTPPSVKPPPEQ